MHVASRRLQPARRALLFRSPTMLPAAVRWRPLHSTEGAVTFGSFIVHAQSSRRAHRSLQLEC